MAPNVLLKILLADSGEVLVRREGGGISGRSIFPEPRASQRKKRDDDNDPILDWRYLLGFIDTADTPSGPKVSYALPFIVFLGAFRRRASAEVAWYPLRLIKDHFPKVTGLKREDVTSYFRNARAGAAERRPLVETTEGVFKNPLDAKAAKVGLVSTVNVDFPDVLGVDQGLPAEQFAAEWLRQAAARSPRIARLLRIELPGQHPSPIRVSKPFFEGEDEVTVQPVVDFTGRNREIEELRRSCMTESEAPCVVVMGMPGVGKTTMVRQFVAKEAIDFFTDGVAWLDATRLPEELLRIARRFGWSGVNSSSSPVALSRWLANELHARNVLIVLDSVPEHVDLELIPRISGRSRIILTTRYALTGDNLGRFHRPIEVLHWDTEMSLEYIRRTAPGLDATQRDLDDLLAYIGGLPLALRLLARLLRQPGLTASMLMERLRNDPIDTLDLAAAGFDRPIGRTITLAMSGLGETARNVLIACSICARKTTADVIAATANTTKQEAQFALSDLVNRGLISYSKSDRPWSMHDLIRLFVERLPETSDAISRHLAFLRSRGQTHGSNTRMWLASTADLAEVLTAADRAATNGDLGAAVELLTAAAPLIKNYVGGSELRHLLLDHVRFVSERDKVVSEPEREHNIVIFSLAWRRPLSKRRIKEFQGGAPNQVRLNIMLVERMAAISQHLGWHGSDLLGLIYDHDLDAINWNDPASMHRFAPRMGSEFGLPWHDTRLMLLLGSLFLDTGDAGRANQLFSAVVSMRALRGVGGGPERLPESFPESFHDGRVTTPTVESKESLPVLRERAVVSALESVMVARLLAEDGRDADAISRMRDARKAFAFLQHRSAGARTEFELAGLYYWSDDTMTAIDHMRSGLALLSSARDSAQINWATDTLRLLCAVAALSNDSRSP